MSVLNNERLKLYLEAEKAVLINQSYTIGNRTYTRADLGEIRAAIDDLVAAGATTDTTTTSASNGRAKRVVFHD